jgi:N utilization substance protein B
MGSRRKSREKALQILFQLDFNCADVEGVLQDFWKQNTAGEKLKSFTEILVRGTCEHREQIDQLISSTIENWSIERLNSVDRAILRFATFEMLYLADIPPKVTINEAVEIAKTYGTDESGGFVNGVLDKIREKIGKSTSVGSANGSGEKSF